MENTLLSALIIFIFRNLVETIPQLKEKMGDMCDVIAYNIDENTFTIIYQYYDFDNKKMIKDEISFPLKFFDYIKNNLNNIRKNIEKTLKHE
jgi:hypothetical protein